MNAFANLNASTTLAVPVAMPADLQAKIKHLTAAAAVASRRVSTPSATMDREALTRAIFMAKAAMESRNHLPVLGNLHLFERNGAMMVRGTDLDIEITAPVAGTVDRGFDTTIPAKRLYDLLTKARKSPETRLELSEKDDKAERIASVDTGSASYDLQTIKPEDFPALKTGDFAKSFTLDGSTIWQAFDMVAGAISTEETRYYLNGVYMHGTHEGTLRLVATDGHRLYCMDVPSVAYGEDDPAVIIPRKMVKTFLSLTKATKNRPESVTVEVSEAKIALHFDGVRILSKLIDGTFPDYHRVIPTDSPHAYTFDGAEMLGAIGDVKLIASDRGRAVKFDISPDGCELSANNPDAGSATASVTVEKLEGDNHGTEIGFNSAYLTDILKLCGDGTATVRLNSAADPAVFTGSVKGWKAVQMPMRI